MLDLQIVATDRWKREQIPEEVVRTTVVAHRRYNPSGPRSRLTIFDEVSASNWLKTSSSRTILLRE